MAHQSEIGEIILRALMDAVQGLLLTSENSVAASERTGCWRASKPSSPVLLAFLAARMEQCSLIPQENLYNVVLSLPCQASESLAFKVGTA